MTQVTIPQAPIIAIIRAPSPTGLVQAAHALHAGGIRALEITLNTPGCLPALEQLRRDFRDEMLLGAGTILTPDDASAAIQAGAQFIVTPALDENVIRLCRRHAVPLCCGCASPTEALTAHTAGADYIKLFPATTFNLPHLQAILLALPQLQFIPTGGVTAANLRTFLDAGCPAVAVGSNLVSRDILQKQDWPALTTRAQQFIAALRNSELSTYN